MKGILEFNLSEPDENEAFIRATKATDAYLVLWDVSEEILRPLLKHANLTEQQLDVVERIRDQFHELMESRGVSPWEQMS